MREAARTELDRIDKIAPGSGSLEAFAFARGDFLNGMLGGALQYDHRVNVSTSVFARGEVGYQYGTNAGLGYSGLVGLRKTF